jgi:ribosomal protein S26
MDGILNSYNLKSTRRIYKFGILKCSEKFKVLDLSEGSIYLWYAELNSVVAVRRKWRSLHPGEKVPKDKALNRWMNQFKEAGTVEKQKSTGRP